MATIYKALWIAEGLNGEPVAEYVTEITAREYGPIIGEPIAKRVDVPKYRNKLPTLRIGESRWVFIGAAQGLDEAERISLNEPDPFDIKLKLTRDGLPLERR